MLMDYMKYEGKGGKIRELEGCGGGMHVCDMLL